MDHPNTLVREYVENGADWQYKEIARTLYGWGDIFRTEFFGDAIPQPLIAVAAKRMNTLASYRLIPNPDGLPYEITFNEQYIDAPLWATLEVLLHEMVHLFQETTPGMQSCKGGYHNGQFVALCESFGLHPKLGKGCHVAPADGRFAELMAKHGVERPPAPPQDEANAKPWFDKGEKSKGKSTLIKYVCECKPPRNTIRSGRKDLHAECKDCGAEYQQVM